MATTVKPFLSLAMIVKNEEKNLKAVLDSVLLNRRLNGDNNVDEIVIVDTGSTDETQQVLVDYFMTPDAVQDVLDGTSKVISPDEMAGAVDFATREGVLIKFRHFEWVDDFSKARQFSFDQCTGEWIMFLDGDDELVGAKQIKNQILKALEAEPRVNIMVAPYDYAAGIVKQPDVPRVFRWNPLEVVNGLAERDLFWRRALHETVQAKSGKRFLGKPTLGPDGEAPFKVIHHKESSGELNSFVRNERIARKAYEDRATPAGEKAEFAYFLAQSLRFTLLAATDEAGRPKTPSQADQDYVFSLFEEAWNTYRGLNFGVYAAFDAARTAAALKDYNLALDWASRIEGASPEFREGQLLLGWIHEVMGEPRRACTHFDTAFARGPIALSSYDEIGFTQGEALISAARAYIAEKRYEDAGKCLLSIPTVVSHRREFRARISLLTVQCNQQAGLKKLFDAVDFYLWDTQPVEALYLLANAPASLATLPEVAQKRIEIQAKVPHLESWEQYKKVYGSIPDEKYHTATHQKEGVLEASRVEYLMEYLEGATSGALAGRSLRMCAIGFQDGIIEEEVLTRFPAVILTVADVAPQASEALTRLAEKFPGRVHSHAIVKNHYDWGHSGSFDLVTLFEVLEHVPDDVDAILKLKTMLAPGGRIILSTPIASRWVEPHLTAPGFPEPFWHVRAHNHVSLWKLFRHEATLNGTLIEGYDGTFVAELYASFPRTKSKVSFFIPGTPQPFNATSHLEGFLGGSEEAVIYLAEAMARKGHDVTVYAPQKLKPDGTIIRGHMGVLWRDIGEFSPYDDHENVIFWRCPDAANMHWFRNQLSGGNAVRAVDGPSWKAHLWLHDASYGSEPDYGAFDKVFVLSRHHEDCLSDLDNFDVCGDVKGPIVLAGNGIDPDMFPVPDESQRDKFKVLYTSSPDRGLERVLRVWPKIKKIEPKATLDIYYDWTTLKKLQPALHAKLTEQVNALKDQGVTYIGGVSQPELHDAMRKAGVWFYPHSGVAETFCISLVKAQACGMRVFTSDAGALPEVQPRNHSMAEGRLDDLDLDIQKANFVVDLMRTEGSGDGRKWVLERFTWDMMAKIFSEEMTRKEQK